MNSASATLTLALFIAGMVVGVLGYQATAPSAPASPYTALGKIGEPAASHLVTGAIVADDAHGLALLLSSDELQSLQSALDPIVDVRSIVFVGATESDRRVLAGYIATGKDRQGNDFAVGFVLRVLEDQVVGVN